MAAPPRIWLLIGDKPGDNAQARVVADALGWPYEVRQVFPKAEWVLGKPKFEPGLDHLDLTRSAPLDAALAGPDRDRRPAPVDGGACGCRTRAAGGRGSSCSADPSAGPSGSR